MQSDLLQAEEICKKDEECVNSIEQASWFVLYTYPRSEKIVNTELIKKGHETFLPTTRTFKLWKNRQKKWIEQVLFPGYIFVYTQHNNLYDLVKVPKIVTYINCGGKPSIISSKEILLIKKMLCLNENISVDSVFCKGEEVRIICGPLSGHEGILVREKGKTRFGIQLKEINHTVLIDICVSMLKKI